MPDTRSLDNRLDTCDSASASDAVSPKKKKKGDSKRQGANPQPPAGRIPLVVSIDRREQLVLQICELFEWPRAAFELGLSRLAASDAANSGVDAEVVLSTYHQKIEQGWSLPNFCFFHACRERLGSAVRFKVQNRRTSFK